MIAGVFVSGANPIVIWRETTMAAAADIRTLRRDLAAALRLAARFDLNEGICNHFSVVVPGAGERYLINPYGIHWARCARMTVPAHRRHGR